MKKILLILLLGISFSTAGINEYVSDVYFSNGIDTSYNEAKKARDDLNISTMIKYPEAYKSVKNWQVSYNHTHGIGIDLYESFLQKIDETLARSITWEVMDWFDYTFKGLIKKVALGVAKKQIKEGAKDWAKITARKIILKMADKYGKIVIKGKVFYEEQLEALLTLLFEELVDAAIDEYLSVKEEQIREDAEKDVKIQFDAYVKSIKDGHGVVVISHSQGNFFTNSAYDMFEDHWFPWDEDTAWMAQYFSAFAVASPANDVLGQQEPHITFDNDLISLVPDSLAWNIKHPNPNICKVENGAGETITIPWCTKAHSFLRSYMATDITRNAILGYIEQEVDTHKEKASQWLPKKEIGCVCKKKYVEMTHQYDSNGMDKLLKGQEVKNFAGDGAGKIYTVDDTYVRAEYGGETIEKLDEGEVCLKLKSSDTALGEIKGTRQGEIPKAFNGAIDMFLTWNYECDIDMDLEMTGSQYIQQDIKDIEGYGKEHTYIDSVYHTYPGDHYKFEADGEKLPDSTLNEETLAEEPIEIRALLETPTGSYFKVWEAKSFGQLDLGLFAELHVKEKIIPQWICPALNNAPGWHRPFNEDTKRFQCVSCEQPYSIVWYKPNPKRAGYWKCNRPVVYSGGGGGGGGGGGRTYNQCTEKEKKETCGCVPCEYIVSGMRKRVENGPLVGADVEIINASELSSVSPTALWKGKTTDKEDIFKSGLLEIPTDKLQQFEDDVYYVVMAEGGNDIDYDDDMKRDIVPVENHGVMHAIIKGSDLKQLPFRVNVLTEAIYQVMGEYMGNNYSQVALEENLDTVARKILSKKLYPADDEPIINYKDILLWTPAVDKRALYKPYNIYVEPIVKHVYADEERYDASYRFIYEPYSSDTPQLSPMVLEIPSGLPNGTIVASFITQNGKAFASVELEGSYAEHFSVDAQGYLSINKSELIKIGNKYRLQARAVDAGGNKGGFVSLDISVLVPTNIADPSKSVPMFVSADINAIYENSEAGTVVAQTNFEDSNQTIIDYRLIGENNASFRIDNNGIIYVADSANIDYEKSKLYSFKVAAKNDAGNESFPVRLSVPIKNQLDTPLFDLVVFEHIEENIPLGSVITTIRTDREGLGDIEKFEILSPHMPFTIDSNGTMYVSNYIDYEQKKQYDFYAIARTKYGNSNKIEIHIVVDDQRPEIGIPSLEDLTISVDENTTSGSKIGQLVLDAGATALERIALYGEDDNFRVDVNGSIYLADDATLDYETKTRYDLGARALNSRGWGNEVHIVIEVNNIADQLPTLEKFKKSVEENATAGTLIGHIMMSGASETTINAFELTGTGNENFSIDTNGTIRVSQTAQLDYESKDSYLLKAIASSAVGSSSEAEVIIYILNIPENPPVLKPLTLNIEENATIGTVLGKVQEDVGGDSPVVSYTLDDNSTFSIDANGTVRSEAPLDYETQTQYTLQVTASNTAGTSEPVAVTVNILNIIDDEPVLNDANFTVLENTPIGTVVGKIDINSTGTSAITSMRLEGIGAEKFSVDANGTVRVAGEVDYEAKKVYHLRAIATNVKAESPEADVNVEVLNVAEIAPVVNTFTESKEETILANMILGYVDMSIIGDTLVNSYEINGTDKIYIDNNGILYNVSDINWSTRNTIHFEIRAHNEAGWSDWVVGNFIILRKNYIGDASDDSFVGSQRDEIFDGGFGDDIIDAKDGTDRLVGGKGNDTLLGGSGNDTYIYTFGDGNDTIRDTSGEDTLILHDIDKGTLRFEVDENDIILIFENNETIRIFDWRDNSYKIEHIVFDNDIEITLDDFNHPVSTPDVSIADLSKLGNINASKVVQGFIKPIGNGKDKVDHWIFNYAGGELIIDTLSELNSNGQSYIDIDGDGVQLGVDIYIYLYKKDTNGEWQFVASDDDSGETYGDGSSHNYDSYLRLNLEEGEYLLAIGNYSLSSTNALLGSNGAGGVSTWWSLSDNI